MIVQGKFGAVCFDCDSTLSTLEGNRRARFAHGCKDEVALLTEAAMNGELAIDDVYAKRLSIVRPDGRRLPGSASATCKSWCLVRERRSKRCAGSASPST